METNTIDESRFGAELFAHLGRVLADPSALQPFMHWFTRALWEAEADTPEDILDFAYLIENLIGIHSAGLWTEKELIEAIGEELRVGTGARATPPTRIVASQMEHRRPIVLNQSATVRLLPTWSA